MLSDPAKQAILEACLKLKEEACREAERRRVEVELSLVEVKESLRKVEAGPFTLGTTVDSSLLDNTVVSQSLLTHTLKKTHTHTHIDLNTCNTHTLTESHTQHTHTQAYTSSDTQTYSLSLASSPVIRFSGLLFVK